MIFSQSLPGTARGVRIFGSVARNEQRPDSDVDFLVRMDPDRSLLDHAALVQELEDLLGRKVHVATESSLHRVIREQVMAEAQEL